MGLGKLMEEVREERRSNEWLLPVLLENLPKSREVDPPGPDTWFTASKAPSLCPRALVMARRMGIKLVDDTDAQARWRMDKGTAMHSVIQELWLGPLGWLLGGWRCPSCAHVHGEDISDAPPFWISGTWVTPKSSVPMPEKCEKCGHKNHPMDPLQYVEPWVIDPELKVRGRTDGLLKLPAHYPEFLDIKTTANLARVKESPWPNDITQLQWYMGPSKCRRGRLLYVNPGVKEVEKAIVEHQVSFDPKLMHKEKEKIRGLRKALADKTEPIPDCPGGGKNAYGECTCVEVAMLWSRHGRRAGA
jgi:hypothetical protein